jgi:hypothetical protein
MSLRHSFLWLCLSVFLTGCGRDPLPGFPRVILWAWESFLAKTLVLGDHQAMVRPRLQPLRVPPGTALIAVVRLESSGRDDLPPSADIAPAIAELAREPGMRAIQIDYDARVSERAFYRDLIGQVKRRLPDRFPLSITALASWCNGDGWIATLPVSNAVPMLFRMGAERYRPGSGFRVPLCQTDIGVSMDEPVARMPRGRRVYIFHPGPWTERDYRNALQEVRRWQ